MFETPVLFTIFNRPEETARVFAEIGKIKPRYFYVAADGPRNGTERASVEKTRAILGKIDWNCDLKTKMETKNLGCKAAMRGAINWFFNDVEEGIILEDDCLPHPDFFRFASELLERYRSDNGIMMLSGDNFQDGRRRGAGSYYFSKFGHVWGWASWRRAWGKYDREMNGLDDFLKRDALADLTKNGWAKKELAGLMTKTRDGLYDTWDFQWIYSILKNGGLAALPNVNLVSNIGFGSEATHTRTEKNWRSNLPTTGIGKIRHPKEVRQDKEADDYTMRRFFPEPFTHKIRSLWK